MSEANDQPVVVAPTVGAETGVEAPAPAVTTQDDDIDTEAFDRAPAPEDSEEAGDGQSEEGDGQQQPSAAEDPELIDVEAGGKTFKVPAALKPFLLMQEDYTKKTQAVADKGREIETKAQELATREAQQAESLKAFRAEHLAVHNYETGIAGIDAKLAEYGKLSPDQWNALRQENSDTYEAHRAQRQLLRDTRADYEEALNRARTDLTAKEEKFVADQRTAREGDIAKAWQQTNSTLSQKIEGWSPAKGQEIATFITKEIGVPVEELRESVDPRVWIAAHKWMQDRALLAVLEKTAKQATAATEALKAQTTTPAVKTGGGNAAPRGVADNLDIKEWTRRRNAQIARKAAGR